MLNINTLQSPKLGSSDKKGNSNASMKAKWNSDVKIATNNARLEVEESPQKTRVTPQKYPPSQKTKYRIQLEINDQVQTKTIGKILKGSQSVKNQGH